MREIIVRPLMFSVRGCYILVHAPRIRKVAFSKDLFLISPNQARIEKDGYFGRTDHGNYRKLGNYDETSIYDV